MCIALALVACQPKQPLQPSYFTTNKNPHPPASCSDTLACYSRCAPVTEECMLLCDQHSQSPHTDQARAVTYCSAQHGCTDAACTDAKCSSEMQACLARPPGADLQPVSPPPPPSPPGAYPPPPPPPPPY